jgi:hypothetical protein
LVTNSLRYKLSLVSARTSISNCPTRFAITYQVSYLTYVGLRELKLKPNFICSDQRVTLRSGNYLPLGKHLHPSFNHQLFSSFHSHSHTMARRKRGRAISVSSSAPDGTGISAASSPAPTVENEVSNKKSKFEKRFRTNTSTDEEVLRTYLMRSASMILMRIFREADEVLELLRISTFQATYYLSGGWRSYLCLCL